MQTLPPSFNLTFFVPFVARFPLPPPQQQQQKQQQQEKYIIYGVSRRLMNKFIKHQYWYISFNIW